MPRYLSFVREAAHPQLNRGEYEVTSDETAKYNCIAHAADDDKWWWWPLDYPMPGVYWPDGIDTRPTLAAFTAMYAKMGGYVPCDDGRYEPGIEKIALFMCAEDVGHAARQKIDGSWTSKLGAWEDIQHDRPEAV